MSYDYGHFDDTRNKVATIFEQDLRLHEPRPLVDAPPLARLSAEFWADPLDYELEDHECLP